MHNNPQEALLHLRHYQQCTDSIYQITNIETIRRLHTLYNYQLREKENNRLKKANERKPNLIINIISIAKILITI